MGAAAAPALLPAPPRIGESERLGATLVLSVLLHAMVILGIGFAVEDAAPMLPTLDVIGDYLTEVNVTSPTCIRELDAQFGLNIAGTLFDRIEALPVA